MLQKVTFARTQPSSIQLTHGRFRRPRKNGLSSLSLTTPPGCLLYKGYGCSPLYRRLNAHTLYLQKNPNWPALVDLINRLFSTAKIVRIDGRSNLAYLAPFLTNIIDVIYLATENSGHGGILQRTVGSFIAARSARKAANLVKRS